MKRVQGTGITKKHRVFRSAVAAVALTAGIAGAAPAVAWADPTGSGATSAASSNPGPNRAAQDRSNTPRAAKRPVAPATANGTKTRAIQSGPDTNSGGSATPTIALSPARQAIPVRDMVARPAATVTPPVAQAHRPAIALLAPPVARAAMPTPALFAAISPTTAATTPSPPQPLSPVAQLLELPGRVINAVLESFGLTSAANSPPPPAGLVAFNDLVFGAFRELERSGGLWKNPPVQPVVPTLTYTGPTTRPTPTVAQLLNASAAGYVLGSTPGGLVPFTVNGFQMKSANVLTGMAATVWATPEGQLIIAYQGTTGGSNLLFDPLITISQVAADLQVVFTRTTPRAFYDAADFAQRVQDEAAKQGYSSEDIFVTGHSLGGWEAQYVAQRMGLAGIGFEAPGINTTVPGNGADSMFVNIGTYGSSAPYMSTDLPGLQPFMPPYVPGGGSKPHFGPIVMVGDPTDMTPLYNASTLWGKGIVGSTIFLVDYLMNFFQYHLPGVQAYHLDVTPDPGMLLALGTGRGPVLTGYGELTIPELMKQASDDGILLKP